MQSNNNSAPPLGGALFNEAGMSISENQRIDDLTAVNAPPPRVKPGIAALQTQKILLHHRTQATRTFLHSPSRRSSPTRAGKKAPPFLIPRFPRSSRLDPAPGDAPQAGHPRKQQFLCRQESAGLATLPKIKSETGT